MALIPFSGLALYRKGVRFLCVRAEKWGLLREVPSFPAEIHSVPTPAFAYPSNAATFIKSYPETPNSRPRMGSDHAIGRQDLANQGFCHAIRHPTLLNRRAA